MVIIKNNAEETPYQTTDVTIQNHFKELAFIVHHLGTKTLAKSSFSSAQGPMDKAAEIKMIKQITQEAIDELKALKEQLISLEKDLPVNENELTDFKTQKETLTHCHDELAQKMEELKKIQKELEIVQSNINEQITASLTNLRDAEEALQEATSSLEIDERAIKENGEHKGKADKESQHTTKLLNEKSH